MKNKVLIFMTLMSGFCYSEASEKPHKLSRKAVVKVRLSLSEIKNDHEAFAIKRRCSEDDHDKERYSTPSPVTQLGHSKNSPFKKSPKRPEVGSSSDIHSSILPPPNLVPNPPKYIIQHPLSPPSFEEIKAIAARSKHEPCILPVPDPDYANYDDYADDVIISNPKMPIANDNGTYFNSDLLSEADRLEKIDKKISEDNLADKKKLEDEEAVRSLSRLTVTPSPAKPTSRPPSRPSSFLNRLFSRRSSSSCGLDDAPQVNSSNVSGSSSASLGSLPAPLTKNPSNQSMLSVLSLPLPQIKEQRNDDTDDLDDLDQDMFIQCVENK